MRSNIASPRVGSPITSCQVATGSCNALNIVMQSLAHRDSALEPLWLYWLRIKVCGLSELINLSVALNLPERSFGGTMDSNASSFTDGSTRV
jgi:hypothetical protein